MRFYFYWGFCWMLFLGIIGDLRAQDPRFSQFYAAPLQVNPAMAGVFEGRFRVNANYRDQWSSVLGSVPFRTIAAAIDLRYHVVNEDFVSFGVNLLRDEVGEGHFVQTRTYLNAAYLKKIGGAPYTNTAQYLVAGAQIGLGQNSVNWNQFWFSAQFDQSIGGLPNFALPSGEMAILGDSRTTDVFLDFNAGLLYYALFGDNRSVYFGGAIHHLNGPQISFFEDGDETLNRRWLGQVGAELPFNDELSILPAAIIMGQGPSTSTTFGANVRYSNNDWNEIAIRAGLWPHLSSTPTSRIYFEAITVAAILELNRWNLGLSYDITTSDFSATNNSRGAFEVSLIYTHPARSRVRVRCPNF
ncbi:MAG: PorP/SprF family type IX secretion system membrane protein [Bacteroidota bacterium]